MISIPGLTRFRGGAWRFLILSASLIVLLDCGGGGGGSAGVGSNPPPSVNNVLAVQVNLGPTNNVANGLYASVTLCAPGSATQCQTIPDMIVDTGSVGIRILASQLSVVLPQVTSASGHALGACAVFGDNSFAWGPVASADVQLSGEKASSVPIQVIGASGFPAVPSACNTGGMADDTVSALGANGILGIGVFQQDCGSACSGASPPAVYFDCPSSGCAVTSASTTSQLQNPVWLFPQDNNGLVVSMPAVPATGAATASGSVIFGIGTQSNNALGGAQVLAADGQGEFTTSFNGTLFTNSVLDTGSSAFFVLSASSLGIPDCVGSGAGYYCPAATLNLSVTNSGAGGAGAAPATISIANAAALFVGSNSAFNNLGSDNPLGGFDFGMPFFYGRNVFVGIENQRSSAGVGPYFAY